MAAGVELDIILRLPPQRLATLRCGVERERNAHHTAQRIAPIISGDIRELDQRWHPCSDRVAARSLSGWQKNQRQESSDNASGAEHHRASPLKIDEPWFQMGPQMLNVRSGMEN